MSTASEFRQDFRNLIIDIIRKILDKSPLVLSVFTNSTALEPQPIISTSKDSLKGKMKTLLHHLVYLRIISYTPFEKAFLKYTKELYSKVKDRKKTTLDESFPKPKCYLKSSL